MIVSEGQFKASAVAPVKYQDWSDDASSVFFEIINKWAFAHPCSEQKYFITVRPYLINTSSFTFALERGWDHQPVIYFINEDTCSSVDSRNYPDDRSITRIKETTTTMCCCKFVKRSLVSSQWVEGFSKQLCCHNSVFQRSRTVLVKTKKWWCWSDAVQVDLYCRWWRPFCPLVLITLLFWKTTKHTAESTIYNMMDANVLQAWKQ